MGNDNLKKAHERAVGQRFIGPYNRRIGRNFRLVALRERPDLEFFDAESRETLGVEVLTGYYSQEHARREWTDARGGRAGEEPQEIYEPDRQVVERVLKRIGEKLEDTFNYPHPLALVVDLGPTALTTVDDFTRITERLFFPFPPPYRGIYLLDRQDHLKPLYES